MKNKISVGEIERYLFYLEDELAGRNPPEFVLREGSWLHQRLGYNQTEIFKRYYQYQNELWLVLGCPDKIDEENGVVEELKTYRNHNRKDFFLEVGRSQANIYCWLTGLPRYAVVLYNAQTKEMKKYFYDYDEEKAKRDIERGIEIKKYLEQVRKEIKAKIGLNDKNE